MRTIRMIHGKTRFDRLGNDNLLGQNNFQDIGKYVRSRKKYWSKQVDRRSAIKTEETM